MKVPPDQLCRFHFRYTDQKAFLRKVLNQVEGFIVSTAGDWLHNPSAYGGTHIWNNYMSIRQSGIEGAFQDLVRGEEAVCRALEEGWLLLKNPIVGLVPSVPEFVAHAISESRRQR